MSEKIEYEVLKAGFLIGSYRKAGETVVMSEAEAKYFLPPHDSRLAVAKPKSKAKKA